MPLVRAIPTVNGITDRKTREVLAALRENVSVMSGQTGSPQHAALTVGTAKRIGLVGHTPSGDVYAATPAIADADTLDGIHASGFALVKHFHDAGAITSGVFNGDLLPAISATKKGAVPAAGTPSGLFLRDDGTWASTGGGTGNVTAASNIADNAVVRGNGGAKGIQQTGIIIDDSDVVLLPMQGSDPSAPAASTVAMAVTATHVVFVWPDGGTASLEKG